MKKEILDLLYEDRGNYLSGESISKGLNITRAAVWKQIQSLKDIGYGIDAQTKKGYLLQSITSELDEWAINHYLDTNRLGRRLLLFEELGSTNDYAKEKVKQGLEDGLVILAKKQVAGRGRLGRIWESPKGGLWLTVVLKPKLTLAEASKVTLAAGLALVNAIEQVYGIKAQIKWPNDIIYNGKKLAGILGEVVGEWNAIQTLILGIGVNANIRRSDLDEELSAVSLVEILGELINLNLLTAVLLKSLETEVSLLESSGFEQLRSRWMEKAAGLGNEVIVHRGNENFRGTYIGISNDGELVVDINGQCLKFYSGEVKLRGLTGYF